MRWRFWKKPEREPVGLVNPKVVVASTYDLDKMKHQFEERGFTIRMEEVNTANIGHWAVRPIMADPLGIEPAFHVRYEQVKIGPIVSLQALANNVKMFKLQVREAITDPKRVARRYWHRYMQEQRRKQHIEDSFLFIR
jgi:hypothetical protein